MKWDVHLAKGLEDEKSFHTASIAEFFHLHLLRVHPCELTNTALLSRLECLQDLLTTILIH